MEDMALLMRQSTTTIVIHARNFHTLPDSEPVRCPFEVVQKDYELVKKGRSSIEGYRSER